jgi:hypothetical protein
MHARARRRSFDAEETRMAAKTLRAVSQNAVIVDTNIASGSTVGLASGPSATYLAYQTLDGNIYVTLNDGQSNLFPPKFTSPTTGPNAIPVAALAGAGVTVAFDPVASNVLLGFQPVGSSSIIIAATNPTLTNAWGVIATISLGDPQSSLLPGQSMISGSIAGAPRQFLFFGITNGNNAKLVYAFSDNNWSNQLDSVQLDGGALNPVSFVGPQASFDPASGQITFSWADSSQNIFVVSGPQPIVFENAFTFPSNAPPTLPAGTVTSFGILLALISNSGQMLETSVQVGQSNWPPPTSFSQLPNAATTPAMSVDNNNNIYVAAADSNGNLQYTVTAFG